MKNLCYILLTALCLFIAASCKTIKHTRSSTVKTDTFILTVHDTFTQLQYKEVIKEIHDTVLTLPAYSVTQKFTADDLTTTRTKTGRKVPHTYSKDTGNIHMRVTVDTFGNITIQAWNDSSQFIIRNLERSNTLLRDSLSKSGRSATVEKSHAAESHSEVKTIYGVPWWVYAIFILVLVIEIGAWVWKRYKHPLG